MTTVYLVRHAEAEGNTYRRIHGQYNSLITQNGLRQIEALRARFAPIHDRKSVQTAAFLWFDKRRCYIKSSAQVILGGSTGGMSAQASADFEVYGYDFTATD